MEVRSARRVVVPIVPTNGDDGESGTGGGGDKRKMQKKEGKEKARERRAMAMTTDEQKKRIPQTNKGGEQVAILSRFALTASMAKSCISR
jgi:hypothetical protein